ncbi:histidine phosphatase family protein [Corynebacterium aquatimens]|uniref:histidine phosphatase family protein n=1 Tax=Corynebacterium TaxID=1716 RepID=UPI001F28706E|nr:MULTISPECIES: histidine phosphatase family protein [Corynebacterium]QYH19098.1 histidine phosphatase family protein [Corynebacterium aquatimens]UIZ92044.1 histidine phosphatase family protein [Corynebacterium sp. CNCTC7651]
MLILLRHGQTTSNVDRLLDTQLPGAALTELGQEQARAAGDEIRSRYAVDRVISSEALRARETAALAFGPDTPSDFADIPAVPGLHEVNAGRWEMQNSREAHEGYFSSFRGFYRRDLAAAIEEGESLELFLARYRGAIAPFAQEEGNTVVVSHGGAIRAFAANATTVTPEYAEQSHLANCTYLVIDPVGEFGDWRVVQWADYPLPEG